MYFVKGKPPEPRYATNQELKRKEERWLCATGFETRRADARLAEFKVIPRLVD
jgi:hypothetical protein